MIHLRDLRLRRGPEVLIESATLSILRGEKVGIVGRNGCGKSSLLALLQGGLAPDRGEFDFPPNLAVASVAQELPHSQRAVIEHVIDGDDALRHCERELAAAEARGDGLGQAHWLGELEARGGYTARTRAASLLDGLGFDPGDIDRPIAAFSGGLRMRANLARALMCPADVLLLDEPTNHLDLDAVLWLENWLRTFPGTLLVVSHDRDFLDAVVNRVLHIGAQRIDSYAGNFSSFETQRAARAAQQAAANEKLRREAEHVRSFIDRFRAKASKARQAQSRIKWLERLPAIVNQRAESSQAWQFAAPRKLPAPLVALEDLRAGYGTAESARIIIDAVRLSIAPGARLGVLGRNGAGKSTLIKTIAGDLQPLGGTRTVSPDLECGFFAQLEVDQLDARSSALLELGRRGGAEAAAWSEQQRRDHLGRFGFSGERVFEPLETFSGGERARVSLAILVARRPNLLLLDEPTNHLDMDARDALLLALQEFPGAVVLVSHDRGLLGSVCDEFVLVGQGRVSAFDGDLGDYAEWLSRQSRQVHKGDAVTASAAAAGAAEASGAAGSATAGARRERRRQEAEARQGLAPLRNELRRVERELESLGQERTALETRLADPAFYASADPAVKTLPLTHAALLKRIADLEDRWLELGSQLEGS
ncbi:MAG: ATP-binding cassette domain-containing protein [Gammaproteobacteria bacterium]|nr:ATP-binding cassette domain-containing protein [Gammaproteobacteria bacterium]